MWRKDFNSRLESWAQLRIQCQQLNFEKSLQNINNWWAESPWQSYYLHWDDQSTWPDPWQLLEDNIFCELARGLGMLYTISLTNHKDLMSAELVLTEDGYNLVVVNQEKYILNWNSEVIVNTPLARKIKKRFTHIQVNQQY